MYILSAWPRSTTLVSPVTISTPAVSRSGGDRLDLGPQLLGWQALLEHQREAERLRPRAGHRQVVDGAVDRELADRSAGEAHRPHDEAVGGHRQAEAVDRHDPGVAQLLQGLASRAAGTSRPSISVCVALPPAPCAIVTVSSLNRGRLSAPSR